MPHEPKTAGGRENTDELIAKAEAALGREDRAGHPDLAEEVLRMLSRIRG